MFAEWLLITWALSLWGHGMLAYVWYSLSPCFLLPVLLCCTLKGPWLCLHTLGAVWVNVQCPHLRTWMSALSLCSGCEVPGPLAPVAFFWSTTGTQPCVQEQHCLWWVVFAARIRCQSLGSLALLERCASLRSEDGRLCLTLARRHSGKVWGQGSGSWRASCGQREWGFI